MDEKKNGSQAFTATGTASLPNINHSTGATIYQGENYAKAELDAVNMVVEMTRLSGGLHLRSLSELADEVVRTLRNIVDSVNVPVKNGGRQLGWSKPKTISAVQAAQLVFEYERIRMVCTKETVRKPTAEGVLAMYVDAGHDAGIYREIGDGQIDEWCSEIAGAVNKSWKDNFIKKRHEELILVRRYDPEKYPKYVNFDGIECKNVSDIPCDYAGNIGVTPGFMASYNPDQFEIIGSDLTLREPMENYASKGEYNPGGNVFYYEDPSPNAPFKYKAAYKRVVIRNKHPEAPKEG